MKRSAIAAVMAAVLAVAVLLPAGLQGALDPRAAGVVESEPVELQAEPAQSGAEADSDAGEDAASAQEQAFTLRRELGSAYLGPSTVREEAHAAVKPEHVPGELLVELADGVSAEDFNAQLPAIDFVDTASISEDDVFFGFVKLDLADGVSVEDAIVRFADVEAVKGAGPNYVLHLTDGGAPGAQAAASEIGATSESAVATSEAASSGGSQVLSLGDIADEVMTAYETVINDPFKQGDKYSNWMLDAINAYEAWDYQTSDRKVTVAVLDSGIQMDHEDLTDNIVGAYSFLNDDPSDVSDLNGHGTHVAGIVAATANNGKGVAGVSYNAQVMPVQVGTSEGSVNLDAAARGVNYVLRYAQAHPEANIRVINMSFGAAAEEGVNYAMMPIIGAIASANSAGILTVCASGNEATGGAYVSYPCDYATSGIGVINAWQSNDTYVRLGDSNYNTEDERRTKQLSAPGTYIYSTTSDSDPEGSAATFRDGVGNDYIYMSGTSMAAPCVAGVAALLFAADSSLTPAQVKQVLCDTALDLNTSENVSADDPFDLQTGYGMVDAAAAFAAVAPTAAAHLEGGDTSTMTAGEAVQLRIEDTTAAWTWSSSDSEVASVDGTGLVTARGAGSATITAASGNKRLTRDVKVYDPTILGETNLEITSTPSLMVSSGNPDGQRGWTWTSSNPDVMSVTMYNGVAWASVKGLGTTDITVTLDVDPTITSTVTVTVGKGDLERAVIRGVSDQTYTGEAVTFSNLRVVLDNKVLSVDTDYDVEYADNVKCGEATVTVTGKGNFENTKAATFRIGNANFATDSGIGITGTGSYTYTGKPIEIPDLKVTHTVAGETVTLAKDTQYTVSYSGNTDAGTAYVTITGVLPDYSGSRTARFTINPMNIDSDEVKVSGVEDRVYDASAQTQAPVLTYNGMTLEEGTDYEVTYSNNIAAGAATMHIWGMGNYLTQQTSYVNVYGFLVPAMQDVPRDVTFQIAPASLADATVEAPAQVYTGSALTPELTVKIGERTLVAGTDYTASYSDNTAVGTAKVVVTGRGNYTGAASGSFEIEKAQLGSMSLSQTAFSYDGAAKTPAVTVKSASGATLVAGVDYSLEYVDNVAVGTARVIATGKGNYEGAVEATFTIKPVMELFAGGTRYDTARMIAQAETGLSGAAYKGVIVVSGEEGRFADALSASGLSGLLGYPILVVRGSGLTSADRASLSAMKAVCPSGKLEIVIVGGEAAVSPLVASQLTSWGKVVKRVAGSNRYETNAAVYEYGRLRGAWDKSTAFLATGANFPDALSIAPYLAAKKVPIVLAPAGATTLSVAAKKALASSTRVIALGGTGAVSNTLLADARAASAGKLTSRLNGANRYETSANIVAWELRQGLALEGAGIATGANFPDALASGFLLGKTKSVLCLVSPKESANDKMTAALEAASAGVSPSTMRVFGGTSAVPESVRLDMAHAVGWRDYATSSRP